MAIMNEQCEATKQPRVLSALTSLKKSIEELEQTTNTLFSRLDIVSTQSTPTNNPPVDPNVKTIGLPKVQLVSDIEESTNRVNSLIDFMNSQLKRLEI